MSGERRVTTARLAVAIGAAVHVGVYATVATVLVMFLALRIGKLGFILVWVCAPAASVVAATWTNRTLAQHVALYAAVAVLANVGTVMTLRAMGWPLLGVDSVELTTLLAGCGGTALATFVVAVVAPDVLSPGVP